MERPSQSPTRTVNHQLDLAVPRSHRYRTIHDRPILYVDEDSRKQFDAKNGVIHGYWKDILNILVTTNDKLTVISELKGVPIARAMSIYIHIYSVCPNKITR